MNDKILIKKYSDNIIDELKSIDFSESYIKSAKNKLEVLKLKIYNLKPAEANILKQLCLSLGFDAMVSRDAVTCKCEKSGALLCGTVSQLEKLCESLYKQPFRLKTLSNDIENILHAPNTYEIKNKMFDFNKTYLMGILNVTPDSFSDGGKNYNPDVAYINAVQMINDGADIIDIGGESTRPSASPVSFEEELARVMPVIKKIRSVNQSVVLSIDTIHPETAVAALSEGVDILNCVCDISVFKPIFPILAEKKTPVVITHSACIPPQPVNEDFNGDIVEHVFNFFDDKISKLREEGLKENLLILDPGIGFGKSINDQFELIKRADEFQTLGCPVLYGISRKSFISKSFGENSRDEATLSYDNYLMFKKVDILRVHDIKKNNDLRNYLSKIL
ncbi:MAG: dihydropteroate synthase [Candidatus Gastranaerophilaceae bacterium]